MSFDFPNVLIEISVLLIFNIQAFLFSQSMPSCHGCCHLCLLLQQDTRDISGAAVTASRTFLSFRLLTLAENCISELPKISE